MHCLMTINILIFYDEGKSLESSKIVPQQKEKHVLYLCFFFQFTIK